MVVNATEVEGFLTFSVFKKRKDDRISLSRTWRVFDGMFFAAVVVVVIVVTVIVDTNTGYL